MLKRKLSAIVIASLLSIGTAFAATPGGYVGAGIGLSSLDTPSNWLSFTPDSYSSKKGGLGGRIFAGYNINEYLGLETGVTQYTESHYKFDEEALGITDGKATYDMTAIDLVAKAYLPVADKFSLYALGGVAETFNKIKVSGNVLGNNQTDHESYAKLRPKFGVGANYVINESVSANFEVSRIQGSGGFKTSNKPVTNADMAAVTLAYNFG